MANDIRAVSDDGKVWRVEAPNWTMQPIGEVTVGEARHVCKVVAAALNETPPPTTWQPISTRPDDDDLLWFARHGAAGWEVDGPRAPSFDDADWWELWAPCDAPTLPRHPQSKQDGG